MTPDDKLLARALVGETTAPDHKWAMIGWAVTVVMGMMTSFGAGVAFADAVAERKNRAESIRAK